MVARQAQAAARYNIVIEHMWHERKNTFYVDRTTAFFIFSVFIHLSPGRRGLDFWMTVSPPVLGPAETN